MRLGNPITLEEWQCWLASTPGFSVTNKIWGTNPRTGKPINVRSRGAGVWTRVQGKSDIYFEFRDGIVWAIEPDEEAIAKLSEIAADLGAELTKPND